MLFSWSPLWLVSRGWSVLAASSLLLSVAMFFARWLCLVLPALAAPSLRKAAQPEPDWKQCGLPGAAATETKPTRQSKRIVHGADSEQCVWRWQVSLSSSIAGQFCGGTLIAPDWVLTAAHCVAHVRHRCGVRNLRVGAGSKQRDSSKANGLVERHVSKIYVHPLYNENVQHDYDFALLKLDKPMPMNECIGVACLPNTPEKVDTKCHITGWGTLASRGSTPEVLQEASVSLLNMDDCEVNYTKQKHTITGSMLCASGNSSKGITDTCQGDSGGPLVCEEDGHFVLRGVTSWGQGCAVPGFPGIYARVQSVLAWVKDVMDDKVRKVSAQDKEDLRQSTSHGLSSLSGEP